MPMRTERWLYGKKQIDGDWYYFKDWGGMYQNAFIKNGRVSAMRLQMEN